MFEAQVAYYLNEYLGKYVQDIDRESLKISIYAGDVVLRNLRLKPDALEDLDLPVSVHAGLLGMLRLKVPWNNLGGTPVVVEIDDLYLLVRPRASAVKDDGHAWDDWGVFDEGFQRSKMARVCRKEKTWVNHVLKMRMREEGQKENKGFLRGLIDTIVSNLQISINNIHVRYEDGQTRPNHIFSCGFTLQKLSAFTVDTMGREAFMPSNQMDSLRKSLQLKRAAIYFDCDTTLWSPIDGWDDMEPEIWKEWFEPDIWKDDTGRNHVIRPVDGTASYVRRWKDLDQERDAATELHIDLKSICASISRDQYCNYSLLLSEISRYTARLPYAGFVPHCRPQRGEKARAWWMYLVYVQKQNAETRKFRWKDVIYSIRMRSQYIALFKKTLKMEDVKGKKGVVLPDFDEIYQKHMKALEDMEKNLQEATILIFRKVAHTEYDDEMTREAEQAKAQQQKGWLGWLMGSGGSPDVSEAPEPSDSQMIISYEDYDKILETLKTQETSMSLKFETPYTILAKYIVNVGSVSVNLVGTEGEDLFKGSMETILMDLVSYPITKRVNMNVGSMGIDSKNGCFVKTGKSEDAPNHPLTNALKLYVIKNPQDERSDAILNVELAPSFVYYDPLAVGNVVDFFQPPEELLLQDLGDISLVAATQIARAKAAAADYAIAAWSGKPKLEMCLTLHAPKISFPSKLSDVHLAVDLGLFIIETDEKTSQNLEGREKGLYECIKLTGSNISATLMGSSVDWNTSANRVRELDSHMPLLDECSLDMSLQVARYVDLEYPMLKVRPIIPRLQFFVSPRRINNLLKVISNISELHEASESRVSIGDKDLTWLSSADWMRECSVLEWSSLQSNAVWRPYQVVLYHGTMYALNGGARSNISAQVSIDTDTTVSKLPEDIIGSSNILVIYRSRSPDWKEILRSSDSWVLKFDTITDLQSCFEEVNAAIHRASSQSFVEEIQEIANPQNDAGPLKTFVYIEGGLSELQVVISGCPPICDYDFGHEGEVDLISLKASEGSFIFSYGDEMMMFNTSLVAMQIDDILMETVTGEKRYITKSAAAFSQANSENLAEFSLKFLSPSHPQYEGVRTSLKASLGSFFFFCNRPTVAALISFGSDISASDSANSDAIISDEYDTSIKHNVSMASDVVLYCKDYACKTFVMEVVLEKLQLMLCFENGQNLAEASVSDFMFVLENISDGCMKINSSLGNLYIDDMTLDQSNQYSHICGVRDAGKSSLATIRFDMYPAHVQHSLDAPKDMICYSLTAHLSKMKIVFLYRFVQECIQYLSQMLEFRPLEPNSIQPSIVTEDSQNLNAAKKVEAPLFLLMELSMDAPLITIPRTSEGKDSIKTDLGTVSLRNRILPSSEGSFLDHSILHLSGVQIYPSSISNGDGDSLVSFSEEGWLVNWKRPLGTDCSHEIPAFDMEIELSDLRASISNRNLEDIIDILSKNISEEPRTTENTFMNPANRQQGNQLQSRDSVASVTLGSISLMEGIGFRVYVSLHHLRLNLLHEKANGMQNNLSYMQVDQSYFSYTSFRSGAYDIEMSLPKLEISDIRPHVPPEHSLVISSGHRASLLMLHYSCQAGKRTVDLILQKPLIVLELGFLIDLSQFFVPQFSFAKVDPLPFVSHDLILTKDGFSLEGDVWLSPSVRLLADSAPGDYFLEGNGHSIILPSADDLNGDMSLIIVGAGSSLCIKNASIVNATSLGNCVKLGPGASLHLPSDKGAQLIDQGKIESYRGTLGEIEEPITSGDTLEISLTTSNLGLYLLQKRNESEDKHPYGSLDTKLIAFKTDIDLSFISDTAGQSLKVGLDNLRASQSNISNLSEQITARSLQELGSHKKIVGSKESDILLPLQINLEYKSTPDDIDMDLSISDARILVSPGALESVACYVEDAVAPLRQPGPDKPAIAIGKYQKMISLRIKSFGSEGKHEEDILADSDLITIWRPQLPTGCTTAGDVVTLGNRAPSFEAMALSRNSGLVAHPLSFESVLSTEKVCIWEPIAPEGYSCVGLFASTDGKPPQVEDVCCIADGALVHASKGMSISISSGESYLDLVNVDNSFGSFIIPDCLHSMEALDLRYPIGPTTYALSSLPSKYDLITRDLGKVSEVSRDLQHIFLDAQRKIMAAKSRNTSSSKTIEFERIWTDMGSLSESRGVSIWRPIAPSGYWTLGDCFMNGFDPPAFVYTLRSGATRQGDITDDYLADPVKYDLVWHDGNPKLDQRLSIWNPVAPKGYVAMGNVVNIGTGVPDIEVKCLHQRYVSIGNTPRSPLWSVRQDHKTINPLNVWRVDEQTRCFVVNPCDNGKAPEHVLALNMGSIGRATEEDPGRTVNVVIRANSLDVIFYDSFRMPILRSTINNIESGIRGYSQEVVQSYGGFKPSLLAYNSKANSWEPILESFDAILKIDANFTREISSGIEPGVHVGIKSSAETIFTTFALSHVNAMVSSYEECITALRRNERQENHTEHTLGDKWLQNLVILNKMGVDIELEVENRDGIDSFAISNGASQMIEKKMYSDPLSYQIGKGSLWAGGMLLLDIEELHCTLSDDTRVAIAAYFEHCKSTANPRTRALKVLDGKVSFTERLVLTCSESKLEHAKVAIEIWDVQGNGGHGSLLDYGTFSTNTISKSLSDLAISLRNNAKVSCKVCWQHNSVLYGKQNTERNPSLLGESPVQRAISIKGSQNVWNIVPELSRRATSVEQKVLSSAAIKLEEGTIIVEGSVENHVWHECFRSNCTISNMTDLPIKISMVTATGESNSIIGSIEPNQSHPLPLRWSCEGQYLTICPDVAIKSNSGPQRLRQYGWGILSPDTGISTVGIPLNGLKIHRYSRFLFKCEPEDRGQDSMVFGAFIRSKFIQGTDLIDWDITVMPPIVIRNHVHVPISLSLFDGGKPLDSENDSATMKTGEKLPIYFLGSEGSLQFRIDSSGYKWAEQGLAALNGDKSCIKSSVRICKESQRIPSEIFVNRTTMSGQFQDSSEDVANKNTCPYPMTITFSSPLCILNKTECSIEIAAVSIRSETKKGSQQISVDYLSQNDPVYDSILFASDGNGSERSSLANARQIESRSMLLMGIPSAKDNLEDKNTTYGIKIRVQNSGWTEPILFDRDYASKNGYDSLYSSPILLLSESRPNSKVYGIVLRLETGEFGDSKVLHVEPQILLQNNSRVPVQAFQCEREIKQLGGKETENVVIPRGGIYLEQQQASSSNPLFSAKSFVHMPDNALNDMLRAKAIFDIEADCIPKAVNFPGFNMTSVCLRQSDETRLEDIGIWSRPIEMCRSEEGLDYVVIPVVSKKSLEGSYLMRVRFSFRGPGLKLITIESAECLPKYVLVNKSPFMLKFAQNASEGGPIHDLPEFSAAGCVAEFSTVSNTKMEVFGPNLRSYSKIVDLNDEMDADSKELSISSANVCTINTTFETAHSLSTFGVHEMVGNGSGYAVGRGDVEKLIEVSSGVAHVRHSLPQEMEYFVSLEIPCISFSIIDLQPQEIALITLEDIKIDFDKIAMPDRSGTYVKVVLRQIQLDNQLPGTLLPVALCKAIGIRSSQPMLDFKYSSVYFKNRSNIQIPYVGFRMPNRLQVAIEESLIWKLFSVYEYMNNLYSTDEESKVTADVDAFVKIRLLSVAEAPLSVSFQNNKSMRPTSLQDSSLSLILDLAAFKGADVTLKGFEMSNIHTTFSGFSSRVHEKVKAELMSVGFSLVKTFGFVGGAQRLLGFLGAQAVKFASSNAEGSASKRIVPSTSDETALEDTSFGSSMLKGFKGLVNKPIEGARAEGFEGAFKGMAKGVVGVFTAPVSNSLAKAPETYDASFAKGRSSVLVLQRKRLPRVLGATGAISEMFRSGSTGESVLESLGQSFLWATLIADSSRTDRLESYEEHFVLPDGFVLIFTSNSMLHIYSPDFAAMDGAAEMGSLPAVEITPGTINWRVFWWDLLAMELRWTDERLDPDRLIIHRKGNTGHGNHVAASREIKSTALAQEVMCFPRTPQASQIKFVANKILSKYFRDPTRQDKRWASRHAARLALEPGGTGNDLPFHMLCSAFEPSWHTNPARSPVVYFWKPIAPPGYKPVGTVATLGPEQPVYPVRCFRDDVTLQREPGQHPLPTAFPEEYSLIWRFNGARPVSMWMPIPPQGYVAMGAIIVSDASVPSMDDYLCIREDLVEQTPLFDSAIWTYNPEAMQAMTSQQSSQRSMLKTRSDAKIKVVPEPRPSYLPETWKVSVWQVDSPLMTLLVARGLKKPPLQLSFSLKE